MILVVEAFLCVLLLLSICMVGILICGLLILHVIENDESEGMAEFCYEEESEKQTEESGGSGEECKTEEYINLTEENKTLHVREPYMLGERMKCYQNELVAQLNNEEPMIVRLHIQRFKKWSSLYKRGAFDERIEETLKGTAELLLLEFQANRVYVSYNEIVLFFYPLPRANYMYNGRVDKLVSTFASVATITFNRLLEKCAWPAGTPDEKSPRNRAYFMCRAMNLPDNSEMYNYYQYRLLDSVRNAKQRLYGTMGNLATENISTKYSLRLFIVKIKNI